MNRPLPHTPRSLTVAPPAEPAFEFPQLDTHEQEASAGLSPVQIIVLLRAIWKPALLSTLILLILSVVTIKFLPKTYTATAELIVDTNNKDPLAAQDFPLSLLNNYVATQLELIQGPVVLYAVTDRLNLSADSEFGSSSAADSRSRRDYAEANLAHDVVAEQGKGGQILYLSVSLKDSVKAATVANAIADVYLEQERSRINDPAGERAKRYAEQIAELREKVAVAQENLDQYSKQKGITNVTANADPTNPDTDTQALNSLEAKLLDAQNARRALEARLSGSEVSSNDALASPAMQQLQAQLHAQQAQLVELSATLGPKHPKVLEVKAEIESTQQALKQETAALGANTATELTRAKALEAQYVQAVADQRSKVMHIRELQGEGGKLALELQSAQAVYKRALDGYDQIMFASVGDYTNVSVVNRATPPVGSKPNKPKLLFMSSFFSIVFGAGLPFLYELLLNRRIRCKDDIERSLGIPVLAQFRAAAPTREPA